MFGPGLPWILLFVFGDSAKPTSTKVFTSRASNIDPGTNQMLSYCSIGLLADQQKVTLRHDIGLFKAEMKLSFMLCSRTFTLTQ